MTAGRGVAAVSGPYPLFPCTECPDERTQGVVLLEGDDESKTTADRRAGGWRIVDWEVQDFDGAPHWFARSWHTVSDQCIAALAKFTPEAS